MTMDAKGEKRITYSMEEVFAEFEKDPEYQAEKRRQKPYYDLVLQIIKLRMAMGWTQKDLAEKAKTFQSRISKIETAEHDIRLSTLIQIAEAFEADVEIVIKPRKPEMLMVGELFAGVENIKVSEANLILDDDQPYISVPVAV